MLMTFFRDTLGIDALSLGAAQSQESFLRAVDPLSFSSVSPSHCFVPKCIWLIQANKTDSEMTCSCPDPQGLAEVLHE